MWLSLLDILYHWFANFSCIRITWSLVKTWAAGPAPKGLLIQKVSDSDESRERASLRVMLADADTAGPGTSL